MYRLVFVLKRKVIPKIVEMIRNPDVLNNVLSEAKITEEDEKTFEKE